MIDRQKLEILLSRRFPGSTRDQIAAAANAIMGMEDEWEDVSTEQEFDYHDAPHCPDMCALAREAEAGTEFRILRRRPILDTPERYPAKPLVAGVGPAR